ncbi:hypothetical protein [Amorphus orientalis]|uniref:Uncharacterized protein n=1 Tax=Amorphus orientalis TaxID=649198 RepID=A0AAE3VTE0_9HYPH|nr:hypothetical protein [Amorphus orientalis]MDQ0317840.1 hypothetical protein [Amorphus orientalis]
MQSHVNGPAASSGDHRRVFADFVQEMARLIARRQAARPGRGPRIVEVGR